MTDRIHWRCTCTNVLSAPMAWQRRQVRCPACGTQAPVPDRSEPEIEALAAAGEIPFRERRAADGHPGSEGSLYAGWELRTEGGPPADDPFFQRFRLDPQVVRRATRRKWWTLGLVLAGVALVAGGTLAARHLWKTRWSVEARMENAGFGRRHTPVRPGPWQEALGEVSRAQRRLESSDGSLEAAMALRDAFGTAVKEAEAMPLRQRARLYNNAAWFLATSTHAEVRDPARALDLAESAAGWTDRRDAGILDTVAEALFASGRPAAAAEVEVEAVTRAPGNAFFREQVRRFHAAAGLPAPELPPIPGTDAPAPASAPADPSLVTSPGDSGGAAPVDR